MTWDYIVNIKAWSSLRNVAAQFSEVGEGVYCVGGEVFFMTQLYDQEFNEGMPGAPFVTAAYWAGSVRAIRHCVLQELEVSDPSFFPPPDELLLGTTGAYEELRKLGRRGVSERATYRVLDGAFINKSVIVDRFCYYFFGEKIEPSQMPYVIEISLD